MSTGERQVGVLLGRAITTNLKDQAAAGFLDLHECAVARLVREVALQHPLASPLLLDQASQRRSDDEQALHGHAVEPFSQTVGRASALP
ncbi:hypothetical protein JKG68_28835 [Microvirga aerilata]|uniref:Uncharacterized protein n=1 Tax=Microvirga aerilata TaxID=670292 RepID=A0A937D296_9HYPH|nr:hypothetical protein [Microvirga aerilata]MBL0407911.1 hypothetical protein [Microvirga aerilata]